MNARTATPPTTPPTIAPMLLLVLLLPVLPVDGESEKPGGIKLVENLVEDEDEEDEDVVLVSASRTIRGRSIMLMMVGVGKHRYMETGVRPAQMKVPQAGASDSRQHPVNGLVSSHAPAATASRSRHMV